MKKILIVDDAPFMLKMASRILSEKYETICASSGSEAIQLYQTEKPDMILSDLIMPEMNGLELHHHLTEKYGKSVPFMYMTADEREETESLGLEAGALDYIRKPFKADILLRRIDNIMRQLDNLDQLKGLQLVAKTDPMTGLLNKSFAQKTLTELCRKATGTLMMIDLDSFKLVNDLFGHEMGDRVLIRFAEILRSVIRSSDVAGRMGGDEFIAFCHDFGDESLVAARSEKINRELLSSAKEYMGEDMNIPLGASIGAVVIPNEGTEFAELYKKADKALYHVKKNGKHGYAFYRDHALRRLSHEENDASLAELHNILGERNRQKGAYELDFESFRALYRFLVRSMESSPYDAELALFSFDAAAPTDAVELFGSYLRQTLRRSDTYTKNGFQYIVLLPKAGADHGESVIRRIISGWAKLENKVPVDCVHEPFSFAEPLLKNE